MLSLVVMQLVPKDDNATRGAGTAVGDTDGTVSCENVGIITADTEKPFPCIVLVNAPNKMMMMFN
jgi:hypothetical protein